MDGSLSLFFIYIYIWSYKDSTTERKRSEVGLTYNKRFKLRIHLLQGAKLRRKPIYEPKSLGGRVDERIEASGQVYTLTIDFDDRKCSHDLEVHKFCRPVIVI